MSYARHQRGDDAGYGIYAKQYFDESPTYNVWNKLRVKDIHALRDEPDFEGQNIYFHLNHPIQYVVVIGIASQIELGGGSASSKLCFIKLDDGSEQILTVKITRRLPEKDRLVEYPSNTTIDDINVNVKLGEEPVYLVKDRQLLPGSVIRVRGTLETYRGVKQLVLDRLKFIDSTSDELHHWKKLVDWRRSVLGNPWLLSDASRRRVDKRVERKRKVTALRARREQRRRRHAKTRPETNAQTNLKEDEEGRGQMTQVFDDGALPGSETVRPPWA